MRPQPTGRTTGNRVKLGLGRCETQEEHTIGYSVPNGQAWKHTSNIVWTELLIFLDV